MDVIGCMLGSSTMLVKWVPGDRLCFYKHRLNCSDVTLVDSHRIPITKASNAELWFFSFPSRLVMMLSKLLSCKCFGIPWCSFDVDAMKKNNVWLPNSINTLILSLANIDPMWCHHCWNRTLDQASRHRGSFCSYYLISVIMRPYMFIVYIS